MRQFIAVFIVTAASAWAQSSYHEVASTKQLMAIVHGPTFGAVSGMLKAGGPKDDKEWSQAQSNAILLAEGGQMLLLGSRPKDQDVWVSNANLLSETASAAAKAAESKDAEGWKTAAGGIGKACQGCHAKYRQMPKKQ
jgi:cytochrome c556